jgi:hypothetical protein
MSVMTADAEAVEIDPPKTRAATTDFVRIFIFILLLHKELRQSPSGRSPDMFLIPSDQ